MTAIVGERDTLIMSTVPRYAVPIDRALLLSIIKNPQVEFKVAPQNTLGLAQFLHDVGAIKNRPASWKDYFFDDPVTTGGS